MAEQEAKRVCFNCKHWVMEPGAADGKHLALAREMVSQNEFKKVPLVYGKCQAVFTGTDSNQSHYDSGSTSWDNCFAVDLEGNQLFKAVPKE